MQYRQINDYGRYSVQLNGKTIICKAVAALPSGQRLLRDLHANYYITTTPVTNTLQFARSGGIALHVAKRCKTRLLLKAHVENPGKNGAIWHYGAKGEVEYGLADNMRPLAAGASTHPDTHYGGSTQRHFANTVGGRPVFAIHDEAHPDHGGILQHGIAENAHTIHHAHPKNNGSPAAHDLSQFIANWERQYAERLRHEYAVTHDPKTAEKIRDAENVHHRMLVENYAKPA